MANQSKEKCHETVVTSSKRLQARENASDPVAIGYNLAYDWSRDWRKFSELITRRS